MAKRGIHAIWRFQCYSKSGKLLWQEENIHNLLPDEAEEFFCDVLFEETQSVPANYYIGLTEEASPGAIDEETTLAKITDGTDGTEPSGNGYARQAVPSSATGFTTSQVDGDYQVQSTDETFTASGGSIPSSGEVDWAFLCTVSSGTSGVIVSAAPLSKGYSIPDGASLLVRIIIKFSE